MIISAIIMVVIIVVTIVHLQAGKQGIPQFSTLSQISARQGISLMLMGLLLMMVVMLLLITTILLMMLVILLMTNGLLTFTISSIKPAQPPPEPLPPAWLEGNRDPGGLATLDIF